jgi:hypothetical protein
MIKARVINLCGMCLVCITLCGASLICGCKTAEPPELVHFSEIRLSGRTISELNAELEIAILEADAFINTMPADSFFGVSYSSTNRPTITKDDYVVKLVKNSRGEILCFFRSHAPIFVLGYPFGFVYSTNDLSNASGFQYHGYLQDTME